MRGRIGSRDAVRTAALAALTVVLVAALFWAVRGFFMSDPTTYPAQIQAGQIAYLDFPALAPIQSIDVHVGETVRAGTILATQSNTLAKLKLAYDQSTLNVDTADLAALHSSTTATATQRQNALDLQLAEEGVSAAQVELQNAATPAAQAAAQAGLAEAETKLALAENSQQLSTPPNANTAVAAATAAVAAAQAAVASDQIAVSETVLTAPAMGYIASIGGSVGELAGPDGVSSSAITPSPLPQPPSFQLFPPASQAPVGRQQPTFSPLITLFLGASWQVVVQVPQAQIDRIHPGQAVSVQIPGHVKRIRGRVLGVNPEPAISSGTVYYEVNCTLSDPPAWVLSGMAANASLISR